MACAKQKHVKQVFSVYPRCFAGIQKNRNVLELQAYYKAKLSMDKDQTLAPLRDAFKREREKLYHYLSKQNTNTHSYLDYWNACNYLGLNMTDEKIVTRTISNVGTIYALTNTTQCLHGMTSRSARTSMRSSQRLPRSIWACNIIAKPTTLQSLPYPQATL